MFYVYILRSLKDRKRYIGFTEDLRRRFKQHNNGEIDATKSRTPFELIYYEAYKNPKQARKQELFLQNRAREENA